MYECDWWKTYKTENILREHLRESFHNKMPLRDERLLKTSNLEVYLVMFNVILKYPRISEKFLPTLHPSSKTLMLVDMTLVRLWKKYTENGLLTQPRRMLISSYFLENWKIITRLLLFYLHLELVCKQTASLCAIHSNQVLQQFCSICGEC